MFFLYPKDFEPGGPLGILPAALSFAWRREAIFPARRSGGETKADYQSFFSRRVIRVRQMIEAVIAILGLFSAGLFVVHAVDAYRAQ